ncbi:MAG: DUF983 domain-containing protein [Planctomycetales bacterium]|nr:DUF983 domain-containing protein [Planctomycetales bacterium]
MSNFPTLFRRAISLRCPRCGKGKLYETWFRMFKKCPECGLVYERETGFYLGAIYFNYGLTALIISIAYPLLVFKWRYDSQQVLWGLLAFAVVFPLLYYRRARSMWLGFDFLVDPRKLQETEAQTKN